MREISSVLGLPDKPMEVDVPKDLVCYFHLYFSLDLILLIGSTLRPCRVIMLNSHSKLRFRLSP